jgi:hypothetical protein
MTDEYNEPLEAKVVRQYKKGVSITTMGVLGICNKNKAKKILQKYGLTKKVWLFGDKTGKT